jgi:O-antigen/teichoic acid export membrane protein
LASALELGLSQTVAYYASFYFGAKESDRVYNIYKLGLLAKISINALVLSFGLAFSRTIAKSLYQDESLSTPLVIGVLLSCFMSFQSYFVSVFRSANRFGLILVAFISQYFVQLCFLAILWKLGELTVYSIFVAYFGGFFVFGSLCALNYPWKKVFISSLGRNSEYLMQYWRFLKWMALAGVASSFVLPINVLILQYFQSSDEVARYFGAFKIAQVFFVAENVLAFVLLPKMSEMVGEHGRQSLRFIIRRMLIGLAGLASLLSLFIGIFARPLVEIVFGKDYLSSVPILYLLIPVGILHLFNNPGCIILISLGHPDIAAKLWLLAAMTNLLAIFLLVPSLGAPGAALASQVSLSLMAIGVWLMVRHYFKKGNENRESPV